MHITKLVDTGSYNLCTNEEIQTKLKFPVVERRACETADSRIIECDVVDNVQVRLKTGQPLAGQWSYQQVANLC